MNALRVVVAAVLLAGAGAGPAAAQAEADLPRTGGFVLDGASAIPDPVERQVDRRLAAHQRRTTNEVVVMTVPTTGGLAIEQFAKQVFNTLGVGRKDTNNGVLVFLAMQDRTLRIQVGTGLESRITNAEAKAIVDGRMVPALKLEDTGRAVTAGVEAVLTELGDPAPVADEPDAIVAVPSAAPFEPGFPAGFEDVASNVRSLVPLFGLFFVGIFGLAIAAVLRGVGGMARSVADMTNSAGYGRGVWFGSGSHLTGMHDTPRPDVFAGTPYASGDVSAGASADFGGGTTSGGGASGSW